MHMVATQIELLAIWESTYTFFFFFEGWGGYHDDCFHQAMHFHGRTMPVLLTRQQTLSETEIFRSCACPYLLCHLWPLAKHSNDRSFPVCSLAVHFFPVERSALWVCKCLLQRPHCQKHHFIELSALEFCKTKWSWRAQPVVGVMLRQAAGLLFCSS